MDWTEHGSRRTEDEEEEDKEENVRRGGTLKISLAVETTDEPATGNSAFDDGRKKREPWFQYHSPLASEMDEDWRLCKATSNDIDRHAHDGGDDDYSEAYDRDNIYEDEYDGENFENEGGRHIGHGTHRCRGVVRSAAHALRSPKLRGTKKVHVSENRSLESGMINSDNTECNSGYVRGLGRAFSYGHGGKHEDGEYEDEEDARGGKFDRTRMIGTGRRTERSIRSQSFGDGGGGGASGGYLDRIRRGMSSPCSDASLDLGVDYGPPRGSGKGVIGPNGGRSAGEEGSGRTAGGVKVMGKDKIGRVRERWSSGWRSRCLVRLLIVVPIALGAGGLCTYLWTRVTHGIDVRDTDPSSSSSEVASGGGEIGPFGEVNATSEEGEGDEDRSWYDDDADEAGLIERSEDEGPYVPPPPLDLDALCSFVTGSVLIPGGSNVEGDKVDEKNDNGGRRAAGFSSFDLASLFECRKACKPSQCCYGTNAADDVVRCLGTNGTGTNSVNCASYRPYCDFLYGIQEQVPPAPETILELCSPANVLGTDDGGRGRWSCEEACGPYGGCCFAEQFAYAGIVLRPKLYDESEQKGGEGVVVNWGEADGQYVYDVPPVARPFVTSIAASASCHDDNERACGEYAPCLSLTMKADEEVYGDDETDPPTPPDDLEIRCGAKGGAEALLVEDVAWCALSCLPGTCCLSREGGSHLKLLESCVSIGSDEISVKSGGSVEGLCAPYGPCAEFWHAHLDVVVDDDADAEGDDCADGSGDGHGSLPPPAPPDLAQFCSFSSLSDAELASECKTICDPGRCCWDDGSCASHNGFSGGGHVEDEGADGGGNEDNGDGYYDGDESGKSGARLPIVPENDMLALAEVPLDQAHICAAYELCANLKPLPEPPKNLEALCGHATAPSSLPSQPASSIPTETTGPTTASSFSPSSTLTSETPTAMPSYPTNTAQSVAPSLSGSTSPSRLPSNSTSMRTYRSQSPSLSMSPNFQGENQSSTNVEDSDDCGEREGSYPPEVPSVVVPVKRGKNKRGDLISTSLTCEEACLPAMCCFASYDEENCSGFQVNSCDAFAPCLSLV